METEEGMRLLLISANIARTPYPVYPLGMSMVGAAAKAAGHTVAYFDMLQAGMSLDALREAVRAAQPGIIGISIRNIDNVNLLNEERYILKVREIVDCVRAESNAKVVLGGSAFSILPELILKTVGGDYGVVGEGEEVFVQLIADAEQGRFPPSGTILKGERLMRGESIPSALYDHDLLARYSENGSIASVQTKRGCPMQCVYCSYPALEGNQIRPRNPARVVDDVELLIKSHGAKFIFFTDSVFNDAAGTYLDVLREMKARGVCIPWSAFITPTGLTPEIVALMKETGLRAAEMGSDAACDATLIGQRKGFTSADVVATNDLLVGAGISTAHYFMFGGPGETRETVLEGCENIKRLNCSASFVFLGIRVLPDTELHEIAVRDGLVTAGHNLFEPIYYIAPGLDKDWLEKTLNDAFRGVRNIVFPPDAMNDKLQLLHKLGYTGSLWDMLSPTSAAAPRPRRAVARDRRRADVWCVIPSHNNAGTVKEVAEKCLKLLPHVVVVDDGSQDADLREMFAGTDVVVLRHPENRGKGAALRTALDHLAAAGATYMITIDADGQHFPEDIATFLPLLREDRIIVGERREVVGDMPGKSRFGRKFSDFWVLLETGQAVSDTQSGFRAYPVRPLMQLPLQCSRYDFEIEVLARAAWAGLELISAPIKVWYAPRAERISSFRPFMDNLRISLTHMRLIGRRLLPWPSKRLVPRKVPPFELFTNPRAAMKRLLRENATPSGLALSAGMGVFLGALPLIGLHMLVIMYVSMRFRLNKVMALSSQNLCMAPVVPAICIAVGFFLRHGRTIAGESLRSLVASPAERLWEWFLGSLIVGPALGLLCAAIVYLVANRLISNQEYLQDGGNLP